MKIRTFDLQHKIVINYNIAKGQTDDNGESVYNWQPLYTLWAAKKGLKGRIFYTAAATQSENDVIFIIHYKKGIEPLMQIICDGATYEIKASPVDVYDNRRWLEIHARVVLQNGG